MSADPFVQDPTNTQSLNRYSYVGNNPLSYTDPSGYFLKKIWKALVAIVVAVVFGQYWVASLTGWGATTSLVTAAAIGGAIAGGITGGGNLRSILTGAISGAAFAGLGTVGLEGLDAVMAYGMTGGVTSVIGGGEFQSGFLAAGFAALAGPGIQKFAEAAGEGTASAVAGTAASAVAGGIGSVLGGGKFENGAVTGAFAYALGRAMGPASKDTGISAGDHTPTNGQELSYETTAGGQERAFWEIKWKLSQPSLGDGWIVQEIDSDVFVNGKFYRRDHYWEAWEVKAGNTNTVLSQTRSGDDKFRVRNANVAGSVKVTARASFHEGLELPKTFIVNNPDTSAGILHSTTINPNLGPGTSNTVVRNWYTNF